MYAKTECFRCAVEGPLSKGDDTKKRVFCQGFQEDRTASMRSGLSRGPPAGELSRQEQGFFESAYEGVGLGTHLAALPDVDIDVPVKPKWPSCAPRLTGNESMVHPE